MDSGADRINFKDAIVASDNEFLDEGGSFILPLPEMTLIDKTSISRHN